MAAATVASNYRESVGSMTLHIFNLTGISDTNTVSTGLGSNVVAVWAQGAGNPTTQGSAGVNAVNSSGTVTLYPGEDSLDATLFVLART